MQFIFTLAGPVVQLGVVGHLWRTGLWRLFPCLTFHLAANAIWITVMAYIPRTWPTRKEIWVAGAIITVCSLTATFLETISRSLEHYPGLSRQVVWGACGIIAAISAILGALEPVYAPVQVLLTVQRVAGLAVAVGAIGLVFVLNYLDPRRRPNVIRHERVMAAMAGTTALAAWLSNHAYIETGKYLLVVGSAGFPALWIWALRKDGEVDPRPAADPAGLDQARAARDQLRGYYDE